MKRSIHILSCLALLLCGLMPLQAQEAFYIYRNDGDFNGFFFDQVEHMGVSKFDLDSVEHEDYVVQEIVTSDSTYRIPLAAIDSIGFQQPEIIFNPAVRHMDDLGMTQHVSAQDGMMLTFASTLPASQRPRVGDVLLGFTGVLADGFGGRVTSVKSVSGGLQVQCDSLTKMSDIFSQFITVEQIGTDAEGNTRHRIAGANRVRRLQESDAAIIDLVNINAALKPTIDVNENLSVSMNLSLGLRVRLVLMYDIRGDDYFIKASASEDWSVSSGIAMKLTGKNEYFSKIPGLGELASIKFPAFCPLFEINPLPQYGIRYEGSIEAKVNFPSYSGGLVQSFIIDSRDGDVKYVSNKNESPISLGDFLDKSSTELKFTGFVQAGLKFNFGICTNSWFSKIFLAEIGVDVIAGPKLEGALDINNDVFTNGIYSLHNSYITATPGAVDFEAKARLGYMWGVEKKFTFAEGSLVFGPSWTLYLLPNFTSMSATYNKSDHSVTATWLTDERWMLWPSTVGTVLSIHSNGKEPQRASDFGLLSPFTKSPATYTTTFSLWEKAIGPVFVMPIVKAFGREDPVYTMAEKVMVPLWLKVNDKSVTVPSTGGEVKIDAKTNGTLVDDIVLLPPRDLFTPLKYEHTVIAEHPAFEPLYETVTVTQQGRSDMYDKIELSGCDVETAILHTINGDGGLDDLPCSVSTADNTASISVSWSSSENCTPGHWLSVYDDSGPRPVSEVISGNFSIFMELDTVASKDGEIIYKITGGSGQAEAKATASFWGCIGSHEVFTGYSYEQVLDYGTITYKSNESIDVVITEGSFDARSGSGGFKCTCRRKNYSYTTPFDDAPWEREINEEQSMYFSLVRKD